MSCKYIIEDSTFIVSLMNKDDVFHHEALTIFNQILHSNVKVRVVIPSTVFYETMFVLLKKNIHYSTVKNKLINLIMIDQIVNHSITETAILKMGIHSQQLLDSQPQKTATRSNDLMIISVAMTYENSCLLTSDKGIKKYQAVFNNIYCFNDNVDKDMFIKMLNS